MVEGPWFRTRRVTVCVTVSDNKMVALLSDKRNHPVNGEFGRKEPVTTYVSRLMLNVSYSHASGFTCRISLRAWPLLNAFGNLNSRDV
jgi:hypothetical protein